MPIQQNGQPSSLLCFVRRNSPELGFAPEPSPRPQTAFLELDPSYLRKLKRRVWNPTLLTDGGNTLRQERIGT